MRKVWLTGLLLAGMLLVFLRTGRGEYRWIRPMEAYVGMMVSSNEVRLSLSGSVDLGDGGERIIRWIVPVKVRGDLEIEQDNAVPLISWDRCSYDTAILIGEFLLEEYVYGIGSGILLPYSAGLMKRGLAFWPNQRWVLWSWGRFQVPYREANGCEDAVSSDRCSTVLRPAEAKVLKTALELQRLGIGFPALVDQLKDLEREGYEFVVVVPGNKTERSPVNVNIKIRATGNIVADVAPIPVVGEGLEGVRVFYLCGFPGVREGIAPSTATWVSTICDGEYITFTEFLVEGSSVKKTPIVWVRTKDVSPVVKVLINLDLSLKAFRDFVSNHHLGWLLLVALSLGIIFVVRRFIPLPYISHWKTFLLAFSMLFGPQIFLWTILRVFRRYRNKKIISERLVSVVSFNLLILTMPVVLIMDALVSKWKMPFHTGSVFASLYAVAFFWLLANPKVFSLLKSSGRVFRIVTIAIALLGCLITAYIDPPSLSVGVGMSFWTYFMYGWLVYMCLIVWEELGDNFYRFAMVSMAIYFLAIICYTDLAITVRSFLTYHLMRISGDRWFDFNDIDLMLRVSLRGI